MRTAVVLLALYSSVEINFARARSAEKRQYDVVVYGATPAGVCASVAARREGATACLVEPLELVGGMMSSGLSFSDSNQMAREFLAGLFEEFHERVESRYAAEGVTLPYRVRVKDQSPWTYEPHVAEAVFNEMLREAGVEVFLGQTLTSVEKKGVKAIEIATDKGLALCGQAFVDASYEGDLLAAAGVSCRIGREARAEYHETLAGQQFAKALVDVSPWVEKGKLLPLMTGVSAGDPQSGDDKTMTYSFRLCVTDDAAIKIPFEKPAGYDRGQFELLRRYLAAVPEAEFPIDLYPIPGGKFDANNGIAKQISLGLVGAGSGWAEASPRRRAEIWHEHRSYTEGLFWFLANDPSVPRRLRDKARRYGLAKDEFTRFGNWPPALYVREARRMAGMHVLTQHDIVNEVAQPDAVAVASFPIDSHDCQRVATGESSFVNEGTILPAHIAGRAIGHIYEIPYRSLVPRPGECDNLLAPVCLSATHVAFCSVRVEPTWMTLGQSAGIAAALVARSGVATQGLDYRALKPRLTAQGMRIDGRALGEGR